MPRGAKPGERRGGRGRGAANKSSLAAIEFFKAKNFDPLEKLIDEFEQSDDPGVRVKILTTLCSYRHPKLSNITHAADSEQPLVVHVNYAVSQ
jgi:hypothetical protein